jgi:cobalt transporter subunit CbtA
VITRVLAAGVVGGVVTGLVVAALQHVTTTPLILTAEVYEAAQHVHQHAAEAAAPVTDALRRTATTSVSTIAVSMGYALILLAAMLVSGDRITPRRAALWGACAFAATGLATGMGLAPQLPGAAETDLAGRQLWWAATAAATGAGLYALLRVDDHMAQLVGLVLLIAPHLFTPTPATPESTVPAELAARFAAASLAVQAVSWILAGALAGMAFRALTQDEEDSPA